MGGRNVLTLFNNKQKRRWLKLYVSDGSAATPGRFYWYWTPDTRIVWG